MNKFQKENYSDYIRSFLGENSKINLISHSEEKFLWEKHIYDSLAISLFFEKYIKNISGKTLLDIGTGGGFPAVPLALTYSDLQVYALDSIGKKIKAIEHIKSDLKIENLTTLNCRVEDLKSVYDIVTSRAVGRLSKIVEYALPHTVSQGFFVAYKSKSVNEEISEAENVISKFGAKVIDVIEYNLPTTESYIRNLVIIQKK